MACTPGIGPWPRLNNHRKKADNRRNKKNPPTQGKRPETRRPIRPLERVGAADPETLWGFDPSAASSVARFSASITSRSATVNNTSRSPRDTGMTSRSRSSSTSAVRVESGGASLQSTRNEACKASIITRPDWYRSAGSFSRARKRTLTVAGFNSGLRTYGEGGGSERCINATLVGDSSSNGTRPVSISNKMTPRE